MSSLKNKSLANGIAALVGGAASSQILAIVAAPILTRIYSPEDFGLLTVYVSLLALLGVISSLCYELAIPLPDSDIDAIHIVIVCMIIVVMMSLISGVLVYFFGGVLADYLKMEALEGVLWLIPMGVFFAGLFKVFNYWSVRTKEFSSIASTRIGQTITTLVIQISFFKFGGVMLLAGQVIGQLFGSVCLTFIATRKHAFSSWTWSGLGAVVSRYKYFPIYSSWSGLANTAGLQLPPLVFAVYFGPSIVGMYSLAHRILSIPTTLIGNATGQVLLSHGADAHNNNKLSRLVRCIHSDLATLGLPPTLIVLVSGEQLFQLVFGDEWGEAGKIAQILSPWLYLTFLTAPLASLFTIKEQQFKALIFQVFLLTARLIGILLGVYLGGFFTAVIFFSLFSTLSRAVLLVILISEYYSNIFSIIVPTLKALLWGGGIILPLIIIKVAGFESQAVWLLSLLTTIILLVLHLILIRKKLFKYD
jgi:O-antigen/teichoic acid export membrane protein